MFYFMAVHNKVILDPPKTTTTALYSPQCQQPGVQCLSLADPSADSGCWRCDWPLCYRGPGTSRPNGERSDPIGWQSLSRHVVIRSGVSWSLPVVWDQLKTNDINETDSFEIICMEDFFWQSSHLVYQPRKQYSKIYKHNTQNETTNRTMFKVFATVFSSYFLFTSFYSN